MKRYLLPTLLSLFAVVFYSCNKSNTDSSKTLSTDEFIKYNVNGTDYSFIMPVDSLLANKSDSIENPSFDPSNTVTAKRIPNSVTDFIKIGYVKYGSAPGSMQQLRLFYTEQTGIYPYPTTSANPVLVTITEYGIVNEYIAGNFSGLFIGPAPGNIQYNVICSFRVMRRI
jgi:hypothetical protein